jgi:hypothetical protein
MELEYSVPCSQQQATGTYPEPGRWVLHPHVSFRWVPFGYYYSNEVCVLKVVPSLRVCWLKYCIKFFFPMRAICPTHLRLHDLFAVMLFGGAQSSSFHVFSFMLLLSLSLFQIQIFSTASCSEAPSVSGRRFIHVKKFRTDKK